MVNIDNNAIALLHNAKDFKPHLATAMIIHIISRFNHCIPLLRSACIHWFFFMVFMCNIEYVNMHLGYDIILRCDCEHLSSLDGVAVTPSLQIAFYHAISGCVLSKL